MSDEEDCGAWVAFSEIGINARMRNALELFELRQRAAPTANLEGGTVGALTSANEGETDGDEIRRMG